MNLEINVHDFQKDIHRTIEEMTAELVKDFADQAPDSFQEILDNPPPSKEGNPPAKRSGDLSRTLRAYVVGPTEAELEFEGYAAFLDPLFDENNYNRPFIEKGIAKTLAEL